MLGRVLLAYSMDNSVRSLIISHHKQGRKFFFDEIVMVGKSFQVWRSKCR